MLMGLQIVSSQPIQPVKVLLGNWGKTPGKIVPSMDRSAPTQQGLAQFYGQRFVSGRMLHLRARGFAPITLLAGVIISGCAAPQMNSGRFSPASREISGETNGVTGVMPLVEPTPPAAAQVPSPPGPSPFPKPSRAVPGPTRSQNSQPSTLLRPGTQLVGPRGFSGTVTSSTGRYATVAPMGGGAPGIFVPGSGRTGTLSLPGRPPATVITQP